MLELVPDPDLKRDRSKVSGRRLGAAQRQDDHAPGGKIQRFNKSKFVQYYLNAINLKTKFCQ